MREAVFQGTEDLPVADIVFGNRVRGFSDTGVQAVIASIEQLGHMADEIHVRRKKDRTLILIAGGHRLEAAKRLGWETIRSKVWDCSEDWARLLEIDDNLAHAELDALELATFLAERKRVFHKVHPEKRQGVAGALAKHGLATDIVSLAASVAEKRGLSQRHVYRLIAAGEALSHDEVRWLSDAPKRPALADLLAVTKVPAGHDRAQAIIQFSNGTAKTVRAALKAIRLDAAPPKDPVEEAFKALCKAFERAPKTVQRRFVAAHARSLSQLIDEVARDEQ